MKPQVRDRLILPVLLPVGILVFIAAVLIGFSRILLSLSQTGATAVALIVAGTIVVVSALAAARKQIRMSTIGAMLGATAGVAMLAGGIGLAVLAGDGEGEEPGHGELFTVDLVAENIAYQPTSLTVPADVPFAIAFDNRDAGVQHNVDIFAEPDHSGTPLLNGEIVTGPIKVTYEVARLGAGTYFFRCVVHPNMVGEITAQEGPGGQPGGPGGPGEPSLTVTAQNLAFDTAEIVLQADTPTTIRFDNQEPGVLHNISIYSDPSLAQILFKGDLITGPDTIDYPIPPLPAGEYYFHCDVHPTMAGTVRVE